MSNCSKSVPEGKDPALWEIARKRASFKSHLISYVIINLFLWALWYYTGDHYDDNSGWRHNIFLGHYGLL